MTNSAMHPTSHDSAPRSPDKNEGPAVQSRRPQIFSTSVAVISRAREELEDLTGYKVDSVSSFERTDDGWRLAITVVELRRIPAATDVLATYEVSLDEYGDVVNYHRDNRYFRDQVGQSK